MGNQNPPPEARTLAQRLYQSDPLLVWLRDRRQISYSVWVVSLALLSFFLLAFLPRMVGVPLNASSFAVSALQGLIIMPLGFSLYLLIPDFVAGLYDVLHKGGVIGEACQEGDPAYPTFIDNLVADVNRRLWIVMALLSSQRSDRRRSYQGYSISISSLDPFDLSLDLLPLDLRCPTHPGAIYVRAVVFASPVSTIQAPDQSTQSRWCRWSEPCGHDAGCERPSSCSARRSFCGHDHLQHFLGAESLYPG